MYVAGAGNTGQHLSQLQQQRNFESLQYLMGNCHVRSSSATKPVPVK